MKNLPITREQTRRIWEQYAEACHIKSGWYYHSINKFLEEDNFIKYHNLISNFSGKRVIDIGFGIGFHTCCIALYADEVLGIDISHKFRVAIFASLFNIKNIKLEYRDARNISSSYFLNNNINSALVKGMKSPLGKEKIEELYRKLGDSDMDIIVFSNYPDSLTQFGPSYKKIGDCGLLTGIQKQ